MRYLLSTSAFAAISALVPNAPAGAEADAGCTPGDPACDAASSPAQPGDAPASPVADLSAMLDGLGQDPADLEQSLVMLRPLLSDPAIPLDDRGRLVNTWLSFVDRHAPAWCADSTAFGWTSFAELVAYDGTDPWPELVVDLNAPGRTLAFEETSCRSGFTLTQQGKPSFFDLSPPGPPCDGACGDCGAMPFPGTLRDAWRAWHAAWDRFEAFGRPASWVRSQPFVDMNTGLSQSASGFSLVINPPNRVTLSYRDAVLASARVPKVDLCAFGVADPPRVAGGRPCDKLEAAHYAPGALLLVLAQPVHSVPSRVVHIPLAANDAPAPTVVCRPGEAPMVRVPEWMTRLGLSHLPRPIGRAL